MADDEKRIKEFEKRLASGGKKYNTQYQYSYVELEEVIANPNEYIIPECLPACEILWNKNIETFMVSNNEDDHLYVLLTNISTENKELLDQLIQQDSRYFIDPYRHTYGFKVDGKDSLASNELSSLASKLLIQDTLRYKTSDNFLHDFKSINGKMTIDEYGHIIRQENPELSNVTLEEALIRTGKDKLYIEQEKRIYDSLMYLKWHQRYLEYVKENINKHNIYNDDGNKSKK